MRVSLLALVVLSSCSRDPIPRAETPPPEYEAPVVEPAPTASAPEEVAVDDASVAKEKGVAAACVAAGAPANALLGYPAKALPDLSRDRVEPGGFDTEGFVVRHFVPAPCPPKALCKPQPPPYLVLAEKATDPSAGLLLETPKPKSFPIAKRYAVSVVLCGNQTYGGVTNEGHLLAAVPR